MEIEKPIREERVIPVRHSPLAMFSDASMTAERVRVPAEIRLSHLKRRGETCPDTQELHRRAVEFEGWVDSKLVGYLSGHPAHWWFSQVPGVGEGEVIAKILGRIESFGRYYDVGDPNIPPYVKREPELYLVLKDDKIEEKVGVWVDGIERLTTPSKLRVFAGHAPGMRREAGKKAHFDAVLKMLLFRLGRNILRTQGNPKRKLGKFYQFYSDRRDYLVRRCGKDGIKIVPTPRGRYCFNCDKEVVKKATKYCPDCGEPLSLKKEQAGVLYEGHLHRMAQARMEQLFLDLLWVVWHEGLGLPTRIPYPIEFQGHSQIIQPIDMVDK